MLLSLYQQLIASISIILCLWVSQRHLDTPWHHTHTPAVDDAWVRSHSYLILTHWATLYPPPPSQTPTLSIHSTSARKTPRDGEQGWKSKNGGSENANTHFNLFEQEPLARSTEGRRILYSVYLNFKRVFLHHEGKTFMFSAANGRTILEQHLRNNHTQTTN